MHAVPPYFPHGSPIRTLDLNAGFTEIPSLRFENSLRDTFAVLVRLLAPTADSLKDALRLLLLFLRFFATLYAGSSKKSNL